MFRRLVSSRQLAPVFALALGCWLPACATSAPPLDGRPAVPPAPPPPPSHLVEPGNLSDAKSAVLRYVDSGGYERDLLRVAAEARTFLRERAAARRPGERLAIVLDIDETALSNLPHMRDQDFGYVPSAWEAWVDSAAAPALEPVREIYRDARAAGVAVLFLTGRKDPRERAGTEANLRAQGMGDYAALRLASAADPGRTAAERKTAARAAWVVEGWTLIASIGDQESDLVGGHVERTFKLPNPFYRIP